MVWKVLSLSISTSFTTSTFEEPEIYSGKLKGLRPNMTSYGVAPVPTFQEVLWDHSTHDKSFPHKLGQRWTKARKYCSMMRFKTSVWPSVWGDRKSSSSKAFHLSEKVLARIC